MSLASHLPRAALALAILVAAPAAFAQDKPASLFQPEVGQAGKDVVWVPTPQQLVDRMLDVAKVTKSDYVIDLGSGDGRTVITAAKRGVQALGIEYNPDMVELAKRNAAAAGVADRARFVKADLFETDFSKATVITMFLLPDINMRLRPKILDLKPGTRIVSNSFRMGDWEPDAEVSATKDCTSYCTAYYWLVPAKVAGTWKMGAGTLTLKQEFQKISGSLTLDGKETALANPKLAGPAISFSIGGTRYAGTVNGGRMEGTAGAASRWNAVRAGG